jgi:hypothetical protein
LTFLGSFDDFLLEEHGSVSPLSARGELEFDRFLFEPFESDLGLFASLEMTTGLSKLETATLKLVLVDLVTSKLAVRLWGKSSWSMAQCAQ